MLADIQNIQTKYYKKTDAKKPVLVIIDSVQDVVDTGRDNTVQAEIKAVTDLTKLQQLTGATILATAQKNKGSISSIDSYGDVMGPMSFIHKPNTVIELLTPRELANKAPTKTEQETLKKTAIKVERGASRGLGKPIYLNLIKSRFTGDGGIKLTYYGAYGYYEDKADLNYSDLYKNIYN